MPMGTDTISPNSSISAYNTAYANGIQSYMIVGLGLSSPLDFQIEYCLASQSPHSYNYAPCFHSQVDLIVSIK